MPRPSLASAAACCAACTLLSCGSAQVLPPPSAADGSTEPHLFDADSPLRPDAETVAEDASAGAIDAGSSAPDSAAGISADASLPGAADAQACSPATCESLGVECGTWPDGCGHDLPCGDCPASSTCQQGHCVTTERVDCSGLANHEGFELCAQTDQTCSGLFTNGVGCTAFCAAAGLPCLARYGGDLGCQKEPQNVLSCADDNGHLSDWCECGRGAACQPATCTSLGAECGTFADGCGSDLTCGACNAPSTCVQGHCVDSSQLDCSGIAAHAGFELCVDTAQTCAGVFTNGAGCEAYCAAAGLRCVASYGGDSGCQKEPLNILSCGGASGRLSDWCECGPDVPPDPNCSTSASDPPRQLEMHFRSATFQNRSAWVLTCRDYAYTAMYAEHEECDSQYQAGSCRGSAHFAFNVPRGRYDVFMTGMHTTNRNPAGALVRVRVDGTEQVATVNQRDSAGLVADLVGNYCLGGNVEIILDSTVSGQSDSVQKVRLVPNTR
ncbi:MAG: hypothetical protein HY901_23555 [Deltaproteobacteria bacterium]|nr:hypothetical protein [Deltaproteobacteria bacterium]